MMAWAAGVLSWSIGRNISIVVTGKERLSFTKVNPVVVDGYENVLLRRGHEEPLKRFWNLDEHCASELLDRP